MPKFLTLKGNEQFCAVKGQQIDNINKTDYDKLSNCKMCSCVLF